MQDLGALKRAVRIGVMATPIDILNEIRDSALLALHQDNFAAARKEANKALLILATLPDGQMAGASSLTWNRQSIVLFLEQLDRLESTADTSESGGMVLQSYSYIGRRSGCD